MRFAGLARLRWLVGALLIAAAALFAIGVASEGDSHDETVATAGTDEHSDEAEAAEAAETDEERIFGVNVESTPLVALAVVISIALAIATWRTDHKLVLLAAAVFAAVFAALDVAEFLHQLEESAAGIAILAAVIALLHGVAALLSEQRRTARP